MIVDPAALPLAEVFHALIGVVVPRPIAWVTSVNAAGLVNLAPVSFFNAFGGNPPAVELDDPAYPYSWLE